MKTAIWKFPLRTTDVQQISMPVGARILCVQSQHNEPQMWAEVSVYAGPCLRTFVIFGTGQPFEKDSTLIYVGTYQIHAGTLVFHVFEDPK